MNLGLKIALAGIFAFSVNVMAGFNVKLLGEADLKTFRDGKACSTPQASWYRDSIFLYIESGAAKSCEGNIGLTSWPASSNSALFPSECNASRDNYLVVATAEKFVVPEAGEYTFDIYAKGSAYLFIDGKLVGGDPSGNLFNPAFPIHMCSGCDWGTCSHAFTSEGGTKVPHSLIQCNVEGNCQGKMTLTAGDHTLKIWYWEAGGGINGIKISWTLPGSTQSDPIPFSALGTEVGIKRNFRATPAQAAAYQNQSKFISINGMQFVPNSVETSQVNGKVSGEVNNGVSVRRVSKNAVNPISK